MGTGEIPILEDGYIFIIFAQRLYPWILRLQTLGVIATGIDTFDYHMRHVWWTGWAQHMCHGR